MVNQISNGVSPTPKLRQSPHSPPRAFCPLYLFSAYPSPLHYGQLLNPVENVTTQPENPFAKLILDQRIAIIPSFTLESGVVLQNVPVAYTTRGSLSENRDNALVICHALSGSADVADWWGPLLGGQGQAFDITRFFVVCLNS